MRGLQLLLALVLSVGPTTWATQEAYYSCNNRHLLFRLELTDDEMLFDVYAEGSAATCGSVGSPGLMVFTAGATDQYLIDLDLTSYDGTNDATCGATGANANLAEIYFVTQGLSSMFEATDLRWKVSCDFSAPSTGFVQLTAGTTITGTPFDVIPVLLNPAVILELWDNTPFPITAAVLGQDVSFRATLTTSAFAFGVRLTSCIAQKTNGDTNGQVTLIDSSGCADSSGPLADTASVFVGDNTDGAVATTIPSFGMFKFTDVTTLYVQCSLWICTSSGDPVCAKTHCAAPLARRRRAATPANVTFTGMTVRVVETVEDLKLLQSGNSGDTQCATKIYTYILTFSLIIGVLAFVLLFGVMLVIFLFTKVRQNQNEKGFVNSN